MVALWVACCREAPVANTWVNDDSGQLIHRKGVTLYHEKPFSGSAYALFPSGDTALVMHYRLGKEHGVARAWYAPNTLKECRVFVDGKKTGEHRGWYENGALKFIHHYQNDIYHGQVKEWQSDGQMYRSFNYEEGQESGLQQMWESDGRLKANYEVRNGRRYGLSGSMNCLSAVR
ncbi:MAG: toxin-antitoxin system YwqK family antitoxin [Bacteroidota bacterium]